MGRVHPRDGQTTVADVQHPGPPRLFLDPRQLPEGCEREEEHDEQQRQVPEQLYIEPSQLVDDGVRAQACHADGQPRQRSQGDGEHHHRQRVPGPLQHSQPPRVAGLHVQELEYRTPVRASVGAEQEIEVEQVDGDRVRHVGREEARRRPHGDVDHDVPRPPPVPGALQPLLHHSHRLLTDPGQRTWAGTAFPPMFATFLKRGFLSALAARRSTRPPGTTRSATPPA